VDGERATVASVGVAERCGNLAPTMSDPVPGPRAGPARQSDFALLAVAVLAVSASGPLIRFAAAPALALAMWRNALAVPALLAFARRVALPPPRERRLIAGSGLLLAAHFGTWVPSLSYTTVASSVALVATQPVWAAVIARWRGEVVERRVWWGIGVAVCGVVVLSGVDLSLSARAAFGDLLAVLGGMFAAGYVTVGAEVRRTVDTAVYAAGCYSVAAAVLLAACLVSSRALTGYDASTWVAIVALVVGPQLLGHTVVNRVLRTISATVVSVAILFEVVGASVIAAFAFDETPPLAAAPAAALVLTGIVIVISAGRRRTPGGVAVG
jgi:drug/metabolite transporter (DMT)-like permease